MYRGKIDPDFRFKISRKNLQINLVRSLRLIFSPQPKAGFFVKFFLRGREISFFALGRKVVASRKAHDQRNVVNMPESAPISFRNPFYYIIMNNFATHQIP